MKPRTKVLLRAARADRSGPSDEARARMRQRVLVGVGAAAALGAGSAAAAASTKAPLAGAAASAGLAGAGASAPVAGAVGAGASVAPWLLGAGAVLLGVGVFAAGRASVPVPPDSTSASAQEWGAAQSTSAVRAEVAPSASAPLAAMTKPVASASAASTPEPARVQSSAAPSEAEPLAAPVREDTLREEAELLARARRALGAGQTQEALAALAEHAQRHPTGALSTDRRALTAIALCGGGKLAEGRAAFPLPAPEADTPLSKRVRDACAK